MKRLCRAVRAHTGLACLALLAVLMLSVVLGISLGPVTIPFPEVWRVMLHRLLTPLGLGDWISLEGIRDSTQNIVWHLRAPRVLLGMLVGAALTLSGVGMQAFTRNPLAEPYVLGISSGARSTTSSQLTVAQVVSMSSKILTPPAWEISLAVKLSPQV